MTANESRAPQQAAAGTSQTRTSSGPYSSIATSSITRNRDFAPGYLEIKGWADFKLRNQQGRSIDEIQAWITTLSSVLEISAHAHFDLTASKVPSFQGSYPVFCIINIKLTQNTPLHHTTIGNMLRDFINGRPDLLGPLNNRQVEIGFEIPEENRPMRKILGKFFGQLKEFTCGLVDTRRDCKACFPKVDPNVIVEVWNTKRMGRSNMIAYFSPSGWVLNMAAVRELAGCEIDEARFADAIRP